MKNIFVIVASCLLIGGCLYQTVSNEDIDLATKFCANNNSVVAQVSATALGSEIVTCANRATGHLNEVVR